MKNKLFTLLILLLVFYGCEKESGTNPLNLTFEIQPLNTGNTWYYIDSTMNGGELNIDSIRITVSGKYYIERSAEFAGSSTMGYIQE